MSARLPISDDARRSLLRTPGVTSVGLGVDDGREAIFVGVRDENVSVTSIPGEIEGFPVIVEVEGDPKTIAAVDAAPEGPPPEFQPAPVTPDRTAVERVRRVRPIQPGVSIGLHSTTAGTSGFMATDGSQFYMLSNNHVIAGDDEANIGGAIVQPGPFDGGMVGPDTVGQLEDFVELHPEGNLADVAWFVPDVESTDAIADLGTLNSGAVDPELDEAVTISGRTSGTRSAVVDRIAKTVQVGGREYVDQFRLSVPFQGGDSGAPVTVETDEKLMPAGLGFASTPSHGFCAYATNVQDETGLTLLYEDVDAGDGGSGDGAEAGFTNPAVLVLALGVGAAALRDGG